MADYRALQGHFRSGELLIGYPRHPRDDVIIGNCSQREFELATVISALCLRDSPGWLTIAHDLEYPVLHREPCGHIPDAILADRDPDCQS
jgi:hypothetical protein